MNNYLADSCAISPATFFLKNHNWCLKSVKDIILQSVNHVSGYAAVHPLKFLYGGAPFFISVTQIALLSIFEVN